VPTPDTQGVPPFADFDMLKSKINEIVQKYNNLLVNLDSLNVVDVTADHISAGTINTNDITISADESGKFYRIDGDGIVANNGTVNTLLFDLATGLMTLTSVLVQSSIGYPKVELNSATNLIAAVSAPGVYAGFVPSPGFGSVPSLVLVSGDTTKAFIQRASFGGTTFGTFDGENLNFQPSGNLQISGTNGVTGTLYVAPSSGAPATIPITFTKGIRTG